MKEIVGEYPLCRSEFPGSLSVLRFPVNLKRLVPSKFHYKRTSRLLEAFVPLPSSNISAIRSKSINSDHISYRAVPEELNNFYYAFQRDGKIHLFPLNHLYLLEPHHFYYPVDKMKELTKRAESREELEHRRRSYIYKLRCMDAEEPAILSYENSTNQILFQSHSLEHSHEHPESRNSNSNTLDSKTHRKLELHKKISQTVLKARIVNYSKLLEIYLDSTAVSSVLTKMTISVGGRFILKSQYYEKNIRELREKMIKLFIDYGNVKEDKIRFLKDEKWIINEIANKEQGLYKLKGYRETTTFDAGLIRAKNLEVVKNVLERLGMANPTLIRDETGIDIDIIEEILSGGRFHHLVNGCYVADDGSVLADILKVFESKKMAEIAEIRNIIEEKGHADYNGYEQIGNLLKKYCTKRGEKYYLKNM